MILEFRNHACKRCKSCDMNVQMLIPDHELKRGAEGEYSTEFACKECGKIERKNVKVKMS